MLVVFAVADLFIDLFVFTLVRNFFIFVCVLWIFLSIDISNIGVFNLFGNKKIIFGFSVCHMCKISVVSFARVVNYALEIFKGIVSEDLILASII